MRFVIRIFVWGAGFLIPASIHAQRIDGGRITIARDSFGVPHIMAPTDPEAAYGLAWAHAEDDFESIQENLLAAKGMLGRVKGKSGVLFDYALRAFEIDKTVAAKFESDLSPAYRKVVEGYVQGINDYAAQHPGEVLYKKAFPVVPQDLICGYVLTTSLMAGLGRGLQAASEDRIEEYYFANEGGSNALVIAPARMADNATYLLSNPHLPNEGRFSWYEAHVQSEEGWNITGGTFPGGMCIFTGTNMHLGWAHTFDYHNFGDIFALEIHPKNKREYKFNGEWKAFRTSSVRLVVKIAGVPLAIRKKAFWSEFGPMLKTKHGYYAFQFPSLYEIRSGEQWFRMNKAQNLAEFEAALQMQGIPLFNVVYGDDQGNILLHSGGIVPERSADLDWKQPIRSDDPAYLLAGTLSYDQLPTVLNPDCGYIYNANHTPLLATGDSCNWSGDFIGLQRFTFNRGEVLGALLAAESGEFSPAQLEAIKFNSSYAAEGSYQSHFSVLFSLDAARYPDIEPAIAKLSHWNHQGEVDNPDAALVLLIHVFLSERFDCPFALLMLRENPIAEADAVWAVRKASQFLLRHHGTLDIALGDLQRHQRGKVSLPVGGLQEVLRATEPVLDREHRGTFRVEGGDCFTQVTQFTPDGVIIHSVNAFGSSNHADSPHFTDQMELFVNGKYKRVYLDWEAVLQRAKRVYKAGPY